MENHEGKQSNDTVEGKITTFASPTVLAAILDHEPVEQNVAHVMVDVNEQGQNSEMVSDSLDTSLNDSLESTELREIGELKRLDQVDNEGPIFSTNDAKSTLAFTEEVSDFPKSSTPIKGANETKSRTAVKASKPHPSQHIIERNKEKAGKRSPTKSSYAQMHTIKARNKLSKVEKRTNAQENTTPENSLGSDVGNNLENEERVNNGLNQNSYVANHSVGRQYLDLNSTTSDFEEQESDFVDNSNLNGSLNTFDNHGPYYDVSQCYSTYDSNYILDPVSYVRGYHSATEHLRQPHATVGPVPLEMHYSNLSTQSAPPRVYGYHREPVVSSVHHFNEDDGHLSSVLPNSDYLTGRRDKILESSIHRKFSSEPYLVHSRSPSLEKMTNLGSNGKASGSYSNLQQPLSYKPYTLREYHNFTGSKVKPLAGGLGPNVDTDDFKEKVMNIKIIIIVIKNWIIVYCYSKDLIGLAAMVYEPLYNAREIATIKLPSGCSCKAKPARSSSFLTFLIKQLFHLHLFDEEITALCTSLVTYHLIFNTCSWYYCNIVNCQSRHLEADTIKLAF